MDSIAIQFMLHVMSTETLEKKIMPLPRNENIFELLEGKYNLIYIVDNSGQASPAIASITVVDKNGTELDLLK